MEEKDRFARLSELPDILDQNFFRIGDLAVEQRDRITACNQMATTQFSRDDILRISKTSTSCSS